MNLLRKLNRFGVSVESGCKSTTIDIVVPRKPVLWRMKSFFNTMTQVSPKCDLVYKVFDSELEHYDIDSIQNNDFLSDRSILFFINYYYSQFSEEIRSKIEVISPEVVQLIKLIDDDEYMEILKPLKLNTKDLIIMPINDNTHPLQSGGTHWSLLVYYRPNNAFYHYDSLSNSNNFHSRLVAKRVIEAIECIQWNDIDEDLAAYHDCICSQQQNHFDCGLFVIFFTKIIFSYFNETCQLEHDLLFNMEPDNILQRKELLSIIHSIGKSRTLQNNTN